VPARNGGRNFLSDHTLLVGSWRSDIDKGSAGVGGGGLFLLIEVSKVEAQTQEQ
jgi:hypothetical protein